LNSFPEVISHKRIAIHGSISGYACCDHLLPQSAVMLLRKFKSSIL
jgi:hypothetical protein